MTITLLLKLCCISPTERVRWLRRLCIVPVALIISCGGIGCGRPATTQPLPLWSLQVAGKDNGMRTLPMHVPNRTPRGARAFLFHTDTTTEAHPRAALFSLIADIEVRDSLLDKPLWLIIPTYAGSARLYIDGEEQMPRQDLGDWRHHGIYRWLIGQRHAAGAAVHIELVCSGDFVQAGWLDTVPFLSDAPDTPITKAISVVNESLALVAIGLMGQISLVYFVLYYLRRQKQYLWFAIEALGASTYDFDILGLLGPVFGCYDTAVVGASLCVAALMAVYFLYAHFDLGRPSRTWNILWVWAGLCICFAHRPDITLPILVLLSLIPAVCENIRVCLTLILQGKHAVDASILLAAWLLLGLVVTGEFFPWLGMGEVFAGLRPGGAGIGLFALVLCLQLTSGYGHAMHRTDALNLELVRQIKDRSRQMYSALAIAGGEMRDAGTLQSGQVIQGRYRVIKQLGQGGMGAVYEVVRTTDGRAMALKVTRNVDGRALARLAKEAETGVQIQDKHVVTMEDIDVSDLGFVYIVMELVRGPSLQACREALLQDLGSVRLILRDISLGLQALHARNIIHRDLKPANVLTNYPWHRPADAIIKIADFGISRMQGPKADVYAQPITDPEVSVGDTDTVMLERRLSTATPSSGNVSPFATEVGMMGTPRYMAPELALGGPFLKPGCDIFSFGIIAYELLTGGYPYDCPPVQKVAHNLPLRAAAPLPQDCAKKLPPAVVQLLRATLSARNESRPTAQQLAQALRTD